MRSPPAGLEAGCLETALAQGWQLRAASMEYLPVGGGGHHWAVTAADGRSRFVTVDDLDRKDWLGDTRQAVFEGLQRALDTAAMLRRDAELDFVVAPVPARDGELLRRLDDRHAVSVFPFLAGRSYPFGPYPDAGLRGQALDLIAALHRSTSVIRDSTPEVRAPAHEPSYTGRADLDAFLLDPGRPWDGGPFAHDAHHLAAAHAGDLARLVTGFGQLAARTAAARADQVITHGEPHPANLMAPGDMSVGGRLVLIDWDTVALAPPERDLSLIVVGPGDIDRYREAAGREADPAVITLYRLRWYLDDLASAVQMFRNPHQDTADTRRWWQGMAPQLEQLPRWLDQLD